MESSSLEIKVMFGEDLKAFNFFQKLMLYVSVSIVSDDPGKKLKQNQKHRTPTDKEGDGNPEWNHEMRFDLKEIPFQDCDHIFVHFELKHEGLMFGDKAIGEVQVPITDLISEFNGVVRFVHYEVRNTEAKPNGVLSFSYKINGMNSPIGTNYAGTQITGFLIAQDSQQHASEIQYPQDLYPPYNSPPGSVYPQLEPETPAMQPTYSTQQDVQYASLGRPPAPQESYYPPPQESYYPPPPDAYYPPLPHPELPYYLHHLPPQSPSAHDVCYPPPRPAGVYPCCEAAGPLMGHSDGHVHSFGHENTSPSGYTYGNYSQSSSSHKWFDP